MKKVDDNYVIKMEVENSGETDKFEENKDDQMTYNEAVSYTHLDVYKRQVWHSSFSHQTKQLMECNLMFAEYLWGKGTMPQQQKNHKHAGRQQHYAKNFSHWTPKFLRAMLWKRWEKYMRYD